jgi:thioredoxin reductase (NADPH)
MYDLIIIGAGPGGLSAATTACMEGLKVLLLEDQPHVGGQISHSALVENLLPHANGFSGAHFRQNALDQCLRFGVDLRVDYHAALLEGDMRQGFQINRHFYGRSVILAMGVSPKKLPFPVEASKVVINNSPALSDVVDRQVVVIYGGGNSAGQAAYEYRSRGALVTVMSRRPLEETMDAYLIRKLRDSSVHMVVDTIDYVDGHLVSTTNNDEYWPDHLHVLIGAHPRTEWLPRAISKDEHGYIVTDLTHMTTLPGVFAIGDVVSNSVKRVSCAIGNANETIHYLHHYL